MIKAVILDIDGVLVGEKVGFNSPDPHPEVLKALRTIAGKGISVSLCTAKPHYAIKKLIESAELRSPDITDGGAVIIDPLGNKVVTKHIIDTSIAQKVIKTFVEQGVYTEFYTLTGYFAQKNQQGEITVKHSYILQTKPVLVKGLAQAANNKEITKIMPIAKNEVDKKKLIRLFKPFESILTLSWGIHPVALPHQFGIITAKGISKKQGAIDVMSSLHISLTEVLGVGDSTSDWQFIELCDFGAAMGNASKELKELVLSKGENGFIGGHVDENGIVGILEHFQVLAK